MENINLPQDISILTFCKKTTLYLKIIGSLGQINVKVPEVINFLQERHFVKITTKKNKKFLKPYKKTFEKVFSSHLKSALKGLSTGFYSDLFIRGIGYKAIVNTLNKTIEFKIGKTHLVIKKINPQIKATYKIKKRKLYLSSYDKQQVTQFSTEIRSFKIPDPYKAKGIRRAQEKITLKEGKKSRK